MGYIVKGTRDMLRQLATGLAVFTILASCAAEPPVSENVLTVYTAMDARDLERYAEAFNEDHPDIKIKWVRDSTGIITAKLLAEKNAPRADVVWGLTATSLMLLKGEGMLEPYAPTGLDKLSPKFRDKDSPPTWTGMDAWVVSVCFNTVEAGKNNLPIPGSWMDLTKPVYKGHVVMPNPNSSGMGFLSVSSWLQMFGEDGGWDFMDKLHENIAWYTHSGSRPCRQAATGEVPIGISFAFRGASLKQKGAPLDLVVPKEGVGWDMEATAIVAGTSKLKAAQTLVDWSITEKANRLYNGGFAVVAIPGIAKPVRHYPLSIVDAMIDNDFLWAAQNRKRIMTEWRKRYDSKSEPRG